MEAAFRRPLADVFERFDEKPVASASIAQVQQPRRCANRLTHTSEAFLLTCPTEGSKVHKRSMQQLQTVQIRSLCWLTLLLTESLRSDSIQIMGDLSVLVMQLAWMPGIGPTSNALQVHKAVLKEGGQGRPVAVKVRHPGVARRIKQDFQLLIPLARATSRFKALKVCAWPERQVAEAAKGWAVSVKATVLLLGHGVSPVQMTQQPC